MLAALDRSIGPILLHGAVESMVGVYREMGVALPPAEHATAENAKLYRGQAMVIAPPSAMNSPWARKFAPYSTGVASGWMQVRGFRRRRSADRGFVLSDHVDWPGLQQTIRETGAEQIIATHGYTGPLVRFLTECGLRPRNSGLRSAMSTRTPRLNPRLTSPRRSTREAVFRNSILSWIAPPEPARNSRP